MVRQFAPEATEFVGVVQRSVVTTHAALGGGDDQQRCQHDPQHRAQNRGVSERKPATEGIAARRIGKAAHHGGVEDSRHRQQDDGSNRRAHAVILT